MALRMTAPPGPVPVCLITTRASCRLVIRHTTPGKTPAWPLLVVLCPFALASDWQLPHSHAHAICEPGRSWYRLAPCNRRPYILTIAA